jgi:LmeA-like phospholipid-binding
MLPLLIALLSLAALAVALDRASRLFAENAASDWLVVNTPFDQRPSIRVRRVPFLAQAVRGTYDDIEVYGSGLQIGDITGASLTARLRGAHLSVSDLLGRQIDQLAVDEVEGIVIVPYSELARLARIPGMTLKVHQGGVTVTASLPIPAIGSVARVSGTASLEVLGSSARLKVRQIAVAGVSVPSVVVAQLTRALSVPINLPALPFGLLLDGVRATENGVTVHGSAHNVVLKAET